MVVPLPINKETLDGSFASQFTACACDCVYFEQTQRNKYRIKVISYLSPGHFIRIKRKMQQKNEAHNYFD